MTPGREKGQDDSQISNTTEWMVVSFTELEDTRNVEVVEWKL